MQNLFKKRFAVEGTLLVILLFVFIIAISIYYYDESVVTPSKWGVFVGGLAASLIVATIQILLSFKEYTAAQKIRGLGFKSYIKARTKTSYYSDLIEKADSKIYLLGSTASSFLHDFAGFGEEAHGDKSALIRALDKKVKVRFLLSSIDSLGSTKRTKAEQAHEWLEKLKSKYPNFVEYRYLNEPLAHSMLRVDDICIVGPIFRVNKSRNAPSIVVKTGSHFGEQYSDYFEEEWEEASTEA